MNFQPKPKRNVWLWSNLSNSGENRQFSGRAAIIGCWSGILFPFFRASRHAYFEGERLLFLGQMARGYFLPSITCPALKKISPPRGLESSAQQLEKIISQFFLEKKYLKKYFIAQKQGSHVTMTIYFGFLIRSKKWCGSLLLSCLHMGSKWISIFFFYPRWISEIFRLKAKRMLEIRFEFLAPMWYGRKKEFDNRDFCSKFFLSSKMKLRRFLPFFSPLNCRANNKSWVSKFEQEDLNFWKGSCVHDSRSI